MLNLQGHSIIHACHDFMNLDCCLMMVQDSDIFFTLLICMLTSWSWIKIEAYHTSHAGWIEIRNVHELYHYS
jgi:hypothetical protein